MTPEYASLTVQDIEEALNEKLNDNIFYNLTEVRRLKYKAIKWQHFAIAAFFRDLLKYLESDEYKKKLREKKLNRIMYG